MGLDQGRQSGQPTSNLSSLCVFDDVASWSGGDGERWVTSLLDVGVTLQLPLSFGARVSEEKEAPLIHLLSVNLYDVSIATPTDLPTPL